MDLGLDVWVCRQSFPESVSDGDNHLSGDMSEGVLFLSETNI